MVIENKSSPTHLTPFDVDEEYTFPFANILDYTLTLPNYFPATPRNISSDFLENSKNDKIPLVFSPFYNNPYLKDMQAFYAKESPIPPPDPITPPVILTPSMHLYDNATLPPTCLQASQIQVLASKLATSSLLLIYGVPRLIKRCTRNPKTIIEAKKPRSEALQIIIRHTKLKTLIRPISQPRGVTVFPTHLTPFDVDEEYTFPSANILNYTLTLPNYFPATPRNISSDFLENSKNDKIPLVFSPFYNNPYLKDMQAFYAKESPIPPPDPITPPVILTPSMIFEIGKSFIKMHLKHLEKQIEDILNYLEELSFHYIEKMKERLVIIPRDFDKVKTKLKEACTQILKLQKKHIGQRDKIAFVHLRISDLEMTLEDVQDRHQLNVKNLMGHTL
nr:hypothetical protein [Tanacetum cinerariifolium]